MSTTGGTTPKQQAHDLIDALPETVTWQELAYRMEVRADIEQGLADAKAGRVTPIAAVRDEFGIAE